MDFELQEKGEREDEIEKGDLPDVEPDLPPEYCNYRDEGCELAGACLECPFPQCLYEQPGGRQRWLKATRNREIAMMFGRDGKNVKELALVFGVSRRTIQRALKNAPAAGRESTAVEGETDRNE